MTTVQDQIATARAAGYSDSDIAAKLATMPGYGDKIKTATTAGYSPTEIVSHLSGEATGSESRDSDGVAQGKRMLADVTQANNENVNPIRGIGETAINAVTGLGSSVVGGFRGLAELAQGNGVDAAVKASQDTQQDYTYQPRSGIGKLGSEVLSLPINIAKSALTDVGGTIGQAVGGDQGRIAGESIGNVAPDVAATLAGGAGALRKAGALRQPSAAISERPAPSPMTPGVDYDAPAYVRNGIKSPAAPVNAAPEATPIVPHAAQSAPASPLDAYGQAPEATPYGTLTEPVTPAATAQTALEQYAERVGLQEPTRPTLPPNQFDDVLRESSPIETRMKSPADSGASARMAGPIAALRDTSDIDATLQQFGIKSAEKAPIDEPPVRAPERPTVPAIDAHNPVAVAQEWEETPSQHANPALREQNLQALRDVGLENIRESAITGNAAQAAREYQHGKFTSEPAGEFWNDHFNSETDAMRNYAQGLVDDTGGRKGMDGDSLEQKGRDIAAPYDAAREYFEKAKTDLYNEADKAAGDLPSVKLDNLGKFLDTDSAFEGRAEKSALRKGIRAYLKEQGIVDENGDMASITAKKAEGLRKYLNGEWSPQNAGLIGKLKGILDNDVYDSAGPNSNVYAAGRAMHQLEKQALDNPNGIAKIMDSDPYTPVNRNTAYENIPNAMIRLSNEQFKHIIDTYKSLPEELQPLAQKAIATLKAHYAERLLNAGVEQGKGTPRQLWGTTNANDFINNNSAKLPMIFDASDLKKIENLRRAGEILRVNPSYPGAAAQLANASKAGLMSKMLGKVGGGVGAVVGGATGGPFMAGPAAMIGDAIGDRVISHAGERKALAAAKAAIVKEYKQPPPKMRSPVDEWEAGHR